MPANFRSALYFSSTSIVYKLLDLVGDPIGKFYSSPNMETFAKRSKKTPVQKSLTGVLVSADHQVCSEVLKSPNWLARPFAERLYLATGNYEPEAIHPFLDSVIAMDGPDHRRVRKLMQTAFTNRLIESWRESSERSVRELIAQIKDVPNFDFVESFANPMPLHVISEIIGVPNAYRAQCNSWGQTLAGIGLDLPKNNRELEELEEAALGLTGLISQLLQERRVNPTEDLISVLAAAQSEGEQLSDREIIATCAFTLIAGFETTANLLSVGMLSLLENPAQLRLLADNPDLLPNFIEESLRVSSPIQFVVRTADSDQVLADGTKARAGQTIILNLAGANRDPKVFDEPDAFQIQRENAKKNVSFGFGAHHCIGSQLARVEAEVFWNLIFKTFPDVSSWGLTEKPSYSNRKLIRSLEKLQITFGVQAEVSRKRNL